MQIESVQISLPDQIDSDVHMHPLLLKSADFTRTDKLKKMKLKGKEKKKKGKTIQRKVKEKKR